MGEGGGFFLACEDFGRMFDNSFPACAFFFFLKWRLGRTHLFHSLRQDQTTVAQRAKEATANAIQGGNSDSLWNRADQPISDIFRQRRAAPE